MKHLAPMLLIPTLLTGCTSDDERLAQFAQEATSQQARQNELLAQQSGTVLEQSRSLAEATERLVTADATARAELLARHDQLQLTIQEQQEQLQTQRDQLEGERRELASERQRDTVLASSITTVSGWIACLLPLGLAGLILWALRHESELPPRLEEYLIEKLRLAQTAPPRLTTDHPPLIAPADDPE